MEEESRKPSIRYARWSKMNKTAKDTDLIKNIGKRTALRKTAKDMYDRSITLSAIKKGEGDEVIGKDYQMRVSVDLGASDGEYVRMLDEGMVTYSNGTPYFYIKRGSIDTFMKNLDPEFVGHIDLGHMDFGMYPKILGTWTKEDLKVIDIGEGRRALDVRLNLNNNISDVKDLKEQGLPVGVSVEMHTTTDWDATEETYKDGTGYEVVDSIDIFGLGIVGDVGNVNSGGIILQNKEGGTKDVDKNNTFLESIKKKLGLTEEKKDDPVVEPETEAEKVLLAATEQLQEKDKKIKELESKIAEHDATQEEAIKLAASAEKLLSEQKTEITALQEEVKTLKAEKIAAEDKKDNALGALKKYLSGASIDTEDKKYLQKDEKKLETVAKSLSNEKTLQAAEETISDGIGGI